MDPLPDRRHRARRVEIAVGDEDGRRRRHARNALVRHHRGGGGLEEVGPDDVARLEPGRLRGQCEPRRRGVGGRRGLLEGLLQLLHAADAELQRFDGMLLRGCQRPRRVDLPGTLDALLLLRDETRELLLQRRLLQARCREQRREGLADLGGVGADLADVRHVAVVLVTLLVARASLHPDDEQDDEDDREGNEPDQPQQRRQRVRAAAQPRRRAGRPRAGAVTAATTRSTRADRRSLLGVVVDEVEVEDVVVVNGHARLPAGG